MSFQQRKVNSSPDELIYRMSKDDKILKKHKHWSFVQKRITNNYKNWIRSAYEVIGELEVDQQNVLEVS